MRAYENSIYFIWMTSRVYDLEEQRLIFPLIMTSKMNYENSYELVLKYDVNEIFSF